MEASTSKLKLLPVAELYGPVIQGEGYVQGTRSMFVRFGLCDGSDGSGRRAWCSWCDSLHAVDPQHRTAWEPLTADAIVERLQARAPYCTTVTLTGGNPALHDLESLVRRLRVNGYTLFVETQGTYFRSWLALCDVVTVSPKPPSAGYPLTPEALDRFLQRLNRAASDFAMPTPTAVLKVVVDVDSPTDYYYASAIAQRYARQYPVYLLCRTDASDSRDTLLARYARLERQVREDSCLPDVRTGLQLHSVLYGHRTGI